MREMFITIAVSALRFASTTILNAIWASFYELALQAEIRWEESGQGEAKKKWVKKKIKENLKARGLLKWYNSYAFSIFIDTILDDIIRDFNRALGRDWKQHLEAARMRMRGKFFFGLL